MSVSSPLLSGVVDLTNWTESQIKELDNFIEEKEKEVRERMQSATTPETMKMDRVSHYLLLSKIIVLMSVSCPDSQYARKTSNKTGRAG